MPTINTRTVKSAGGDYTSLSAWEAGRQGNLTVTDAIEIVECYNKTDTLPLFLSGWTTSATQYISILAVGAGRHAGVWDSSKYELVLTASTPIQVTEEYVRIDGLQIHLNLPTGVQHGILILGLTTSAPNDIRISNCIIKRTPNAAGTMMGIWLNDSNQQNPKVWNNIIYGFTSGIDKNSGITATAYNNTVIDCTTNGIRNAGATANFRVKNNLVINCGTNYTGGFTADSNYNVSSAASGAPGAQSVHNASPTFVNAGAKDYHLDLSDTAATGKGTNLSADAQIAFGTDINGDTILGTWSAGADWNLYVTNRAYLLDGLILKGALVR